MITISQYFEAHLKSMKKIFLLFITFYCIGGAAVAATELPRELETLMRPLGQLAGWRLDGKPQYAVGDDLFTLINGGAEIYHEYGFKQAVIARYTDGKGRSFNLELYEMADDDAAFGVYTFKIGNNGKQFKLGCENQLEDYYLNLRKGRYVLTLVALKTDPVTIDAMVAAARKIAGVIKQNSTSPLLVSKLKKSIEDGLSIKQLKYFKGHLALYNFYSFDTRDLFQLQEGVAVEFNEFTFFVFKYSNESSSAKSFSNARTILKENDRYKQIKAVDNSKFAMRDEDGLASTMERRGEYLFILQSRNIRQHYSAFKKITDEL